MEITSLCWNPNYKDLFAVGFGSYNFYEQVRTIDSFCHETSNNLKGSSQDKGVSSYVCVFSLKNPSFPEYLCATNSGVMCVDIHSKHPHMLAAGLADGTVAVYNMQEINNYTMRIAIPKCLSSPADCAYPLR